MKRESKYEDLIRFARESLGFSKSIPIKLTPLKERGSDRIFFRLQWDHKDSAILIHYDPRRVENRYYADISIFLHHIDIPVPRLIYHDSIKCLILIEDLGNLDLWSFRNKSWKVRKPLYQKTLLIIHRLHCFPKKEFPLRQVKLMDAFTLSLYRWEFDYFMEHFVKNICGIEIKPSFREKLEKEVSTLGKRLLRGKRSLIHRDLQSQNVIIQNGNPFLIDFQGMRFGNPFYDLGSLLCDPYVHFSNEEREELLSFYYGLIPENPGWINFQKNFWEASAQRLIQALGAYGFLGIQKNLKAYLKYIPAGLNHLYQATTFVTLLPQLHNLLEECQRVIKTKKYG